MTLASTALLIACLSCSTPGVTRPPPQTGAAPQGVKVWQTTRAEVYAMLGTEYVEEAGRDVIYYSPESLIPKDEDGLPCYRCPADAFGARITFRDDVVVKYQLVRP